MTSPRPNTTSMPNRVIPGAYASPRTDPPNLDRDRLDPRLARERPRRVLRARPDRARLQRRNQGQAQHLVHLVHEVDLEPALEMRRDLVDVLLVELGDEDDGD